MANNEKSKTISWSFTGEASWARLTTPDPTYDNYHVTLKLDGPSIESFLKSGLQIQVKDGKVKFRRPTKKVINDELVTFGPPEIYNSESQPYFKGKVPLIGDGSNITVRVLVFPTLKGPGHRLQAVRVNNLVEFKRSEDAEINQERGFIPF